MAASAARTTLRGVGESVAALRETRLTNNNAAPSPHARTDAPHRTTTGFTASNARLTRGTPWPSRHAANHIAPTSATPPITPNTRSPTSVAPMPVAIHARSRSNHRIGKESNSLDRHIIDSEVAEATLTLLTSSRQSAPALKRNVAYSAAARIVVASEIDHSSRGNRSGRETEAEAPPARRRISDRDVRVDPRLCALLLCAKVCQTVLSNGLFYRCDDKRRAILPNELCGLRPSELVAKARLLHESRAAASRERRPSSRARCGMRALSR